MVLRLDWRLRSEIGVKSTEYIVMSHATHHGIAFQYLRETRVRLFVGRTGLESSLSQFEVSDHSPVSMVRRRIRRPGERSTFAALKARLSIADMLDGVPSKSR
jgi:hypothetical protein